MKNKEGFTLVELLAVIIILGVLLLIGNMTFNSITKNVKENQHENLVKKIKIAAENYFDDKNVTTVNVLTLIENGYLTADNNKNELKSPSTGKDLKCYKLTKSSVDDEIIIEDASCGSDAEFVTSDLNIVYCFDQSGSNCYTYNASQNYEWQNGVNKINGVGTKGTIYLRAVLVQTGGTRKLKEKTGVVFKWTNPINPDKVYNTEYVKIEFGSSSKNNGELNEMFQLTYKENGKEYVANKQIMLDAIIPECTIENKINDRTTTGLTYELVCNDIGGSKVKTCDSVTDKTTIKYIDIKETQEYEVFDAAGNKNSCKIEILSQIQQQNCTLCKDCSDAGCDDWDTKQECTAWSAYSKTASNYTKKPSNTNTIQYQCTTMNMFYSCKRRTRSCSTKTYCADNRRDCFVCKGCSTWNGTWSDVDTCDEENYSIKCQTIYHFKEEQ